MNLEKLQVRSNNLFTIIKFIRKDRLHYIWRAPTDNDRYLRAEWEAAGYDRSIIKVRDVSVEHSARKVEITCRLMITAVSVQRILDIDAKWFVDPEGEIGCRVVCRRDPQLPMLPRLGLRLFLPETLENVEYYGYGPYESYVDKHQASWLDTFYDNVERMHEDYIRPQEKRKPLELRICEIDR